MKNPNGCALETRWHSFEVSIRHAYRRGSDGVLRPSRPERVTPADAETTFSRETIRLSGFVDCIETLVASYGSEYPRNEKKKTYEIVVLLTMIKSMSLSIE